METETAISLESLQQESIEADRKKYATEVDISRIIAKHYVYPDYISDGQNLFKFVGSTEQMRRAGLSSAVPWGIETQYEPMDQTEFVDDFLSHCILPDDRWKYANMEKKKFRQNQYELIAEDLKSRMNRAKVYIHPVSNSIENMPCMVKLIIDGNTDPFVSSHAQDVVDEFLERMTNSDAFLMRLITSFWTTANRDQMIYLEGVGRDSKSTFISAFQKFIGNNVWTQHSDANAAFRDKFATEDLEDKRFLILPELKKNMLKTHLIKHLTGDEFITVTSKYKKVKPHVRNNIIILMHSNCSPDVQNEFSIMRRIIHCKMKQYTGESVAGIVDIFFNAMPYLMKKAYDVWCQNGKPLGLLPVDNATLDEIQTSGEDDSADEFVDKIIEHCFVADSDGFVSRADFRAILNDFTKTKIGEPYRSFMSNDNKFNKIKEVLAKRGFSSVQKKKIKGYRNLAAINREETLEHKQERESEEITAQVNFNRYEMEMETIRQQNLKPPKPIDLQAFIEEQLGKKVH